jgi:hypothetical protein
MTEQQQFEVSGSYYEACNCEAICPCRRINGLPGGDSTYGNCDFLLNWNIINGRCGDVDVSGQAVAMAGQYHDDEEGSPWSVYLYVSQSASDAQLAALSQVFLGKLGGNLGFTGAITRVMGVRRADIVFDHTDGKQFVTVDNVAEARLDRVVAFDGTVSCGIPGHESPGKENVSTLHLKEAELEFAYRERCGFATDFTYKN